MLQNIIASTPEEPLPVAAESTPSLAPQDVEQRVGPEISCAQLVEEEATSSEFFLGQSEASKKSEYVQ